MDGILLIDKPSGWTSFDVVAKVRSILKKAGVEKPKVGHTGTLDPLATGLLVLVVGGYTKRAGEFSKLDKTYEVTMKLGQTSTTGDEEGEILPYVPPSEKSQQSRSLPKASGALRRQDLRSSVSVPSSTLSSGARPFLALHPDTNGRVPSREAIEAVFKEFEGEIEQVPPQFSAIKVNGQRAYKLARKGQKVELEPRKVTVYRLQVTEYRYPEVKFTADVSSGTYIRSLVEDMGNKLGTGAYMSALRRSKVGEFKLTDAYSIENIIDGIKTIKLLT